MKRKNDILNYKSKQEHKASELTKEELANATRLLESICLRVIDRQHKLLLEKKLQTSKMPK